MHGHFESSISEIHKTPRRSGRVVSSVAAGAVALLISACGGGNTTSTNDSYLAVEGAQSLGGPTFTACVDGVEIFDPVAPQSQRVAADLAAHYRLVGAYRSFGGEGQNCRQRFPAANAVLSTEDLSCKVARSREPACLR